MHIHWEHFDRGSDIGVRGFGATEAAALEQAAEAARKVARLEPLICIKG